MSVSRSIARIRKFRIEKGLSKREFAALAGLPFPSSLTPIDSNGWNPTLATIKALEAVIPEDWKPSRRKRAA